MFSLLQPRRLCVRLPAGAPAFRGFVSRPAGSLPLLRLACAAGACLPFACHALVCAGLLLPLFGLFGSPRRSAGRCCRPASARKASCRCARIPRLCFRFAPGLRVLLPAAFARTFTAAVCLPSVRLCVRAFMLLSFALFLPHFCLSKFFSFVAHAATGTPFSFRKENGGKEPRGGATAPPSNPHSCALRPIFFSSALLAGLRGPLGRKPPADGETLEKPGSRAQLFKRFCAKEDACALRLFSPFFSLLAGLRGPLGRKSPAGGETPEKPKEQSSAFRAFLCSGDAPGLSPGGFSPSCREQKLSFLPARENRSHARARTRKQQRACEAGRSHKHGARLARRRRGLSPCPGKQKLSAGTHLKPIACVRDWAQP